MKDEQENSAPYTVEEAVKRIGEGHGQKTLKQKEMRRAGVANQDEYKKLIRDTLTDKETKAFKAHNDRDVFYNAKTKTMVVVDLKRDDLGTCYKPTAKERAFNKELQRTIEHNEKNGLEKPQVKEGGYHGLYGQEKEKSKSGDTSQSKAQSEDEEIKTRLEKLRRDMEQKDKNKGRDR